MTKEHAYAYEAGYRDGSINYELEHCPACKNIADLQDALAENAKLRDENARLRSCLSDDADNARQIMGENKKLLELAKLAVHSACFGCPHNDKNAWRSCGGCNLYEMATELGIEVDG